MSKPRKRRYTAAVDDERCHADIYFHGEGGRCTRRKVLGNLCRQHANIFGCTVVTKNEQPKKVHDRGCSIFIERILKCDCGFEFWCDGCGTGSDESPPEHTQDCPLRSIDIARNV